MEKLPDTAGARSCVDSVRWDAATKCLSEAREISKTLSLNKDTKPFLNEIVRWHKHLAYQAGNGNEEIWKLTAEWFRVLRTCCLNGKDIQIFIARETSAVFNTVLILDKLWEENDTDVKDKAIVALRCGTQFLGNLVTQNGETGQIVWDHGQSLIKQQLSSADKKLSSYTSLVLLNIMSQCPNIKDDITREVLVNLLDLVGLDCEFGLFCIEKLLSWEMVLYQLHVEGLDSARKRQLLEILHSALTRTSSDSQALSSQRCEKLVVHVSNIEFLVQWFKDKSDVILKTCECDTDTMDAGEVALTLEVLAAAASLEPYTKFLQMNKSLLLGVIYLLKGMHELGKADINFFSKVEKASAFLSQGGTKELSQHPAFGFKANLVRLIGSLCWKNCENQYVVLENEVVPVILDCCSLDARNPFIPQCSILTLKALCEGNVDIQNVIIGMKVQGGVQSEVLAEMGLQLQDCDGKVVVTRKLS